MRQITFILFNILLTSNIFAQTNQTTISPEKKKIYTDKAKADLTLYFKENKIKNEALANYDLSKPYINKGKTFLIGDPDPTNFILVCFPRKTAKGCVYFFYQLYQKGDLSFLAQGFESKQPDVIFKDADNIIGGGEVEGEYENESAVSEPQNPEIIGHASYSNNKGKYYKNQKWKFLIDQYYFQPIYVENTLTNRIHLTYSMLPQEPDNGTPTKGPIHEIDICEYGDYLIVACNYLTQSGTKKKEGKVLKSSAKKISEGHYLISISGTTDAFKMTLELKKENDVFTKLYAVAINYGLVSDYSWDTVLDIPATITPTTR